MSFLVFIFRDGIVTEYCHHHMTGCVWISCRCCIFFFCAVPVFLSLIQYFRHVCVFLCAPVSLQLSPALSEGRPQPGVPRGVVAHSSGSRNHDAFCRGTERRLEVEWWRGRWGIPIRWDNMEPLLRQPVDRARWVNGASLSYGAAVW